MTLILFLISAWVIWATEDPEAFLSMPDTLLNVGAYLVFGYTGMNLLAEWLS